MNKKISSKNKVLLIWPFNGYDGSTVPLCYIYLIPMLRKNYQVKFLDCALHEIHPDSEKFTEIINDFKPDRASRNKWSACDERACV